MGKKVLMIVGSMRENSFNRQLARMAEGLIRGKAEVSFLDYSDLPYMNQDIEFPAPAAVARVRREVAEADGIWIFTPEYNFSYPGVLKNLLDWLSRPLDAGDPQRKTAISGKKVTICGAGGKAAAAGSRGKLRELLNRMETQVLEEQETGIALGAEAFQTDVLTVSGEDRASLQMQAEAFLRFIGV